MIFYFSGTGNTKWAAETIGHIIGDNVFNIADEINGSCKYVLTEGERIGFCFPIHGWQPPKIVKEFISKCTFTNKNNNYCFVLCTCGSEIGLTMDIFAKVLKKIGLCANSMFSVKMPNTYICLPFMDTDGENLEKEKIHNANIELKRIANYIKNYSCGIESLTKGPVPFILTYVIGELFKLCMLTDKPFRVDYNKCINCGRCAKSCPTNNIIYDINKNPKWKHINKCTCCMACYHICPAHAINYGIMTQHKGQYYFRNK